MMKFIRALAVLLLLPAAALAQPAGQLQSGQVWGNATAARAAAQGASITAMIDRAISGVQGAVMTRNASAWVGLAPGTLGLPLLSGGAGANLAYGIPALAAGGTGANLTASNGGIFYSTGTVGAILSGTSTARQMLQSGSSAAPAWSITLWPATTTINRLLWSSAANVISDLATANNGVLITSAGGVPSIATTLPSALSIPAPTITGGTHTAVTSLGIRSTGAAFDLTLASSEVFTAGRALTVTLNDAARTLNMGGNITTAAAFTTAGANALTLTTTGSTNVTLPLTGTLSTLAGAESLSNKTIASPTFSGTFAGTYTIAGTPTLSGTFAGTPTFSGANFISNANLAQAGAYTLRGNPTASTANVQDFAVSSLTAKTSPASTDLLVVQDASSGALVKSTVAQIVGGVGSVTSFNTRTGPVVPTTGDYAFSQITGTVSPTQGGFGADAHLDAANSVRVADGSGNFVTTAIFSLLNAACSNSVTRPVCVSFMGRADVTWWGAVCNSAGNDQAAVQAAIDYIYTTYTGGNVFIGLGKTCRVTSGLVLKGGVVIVGASRQYTALIAPTDFTLLTFDATCAYCGFNNIFIIGYQGAAAATPAVNISAATPYTIKDSFVWGGSNAINNNGVDGIMFNTDVQQANTSGVGISSTGANWYERVKIDNSGAGFAAFSQGASAALSENHFVDCDFSAFPYTYSIYIDDGGTSRALTTITGGTFSNAILILNARSTIFQGGEFGNASIVSASPLIITGSYGFAATTASGAGTRSCAGNINITC